MLSRSGHGADSSAARLSYPALPALVRCSASPAARLFFPASLVVALRSASLAAHLFIPACPFVASRAASPAGFVFLIRLARFGSAPDFFVCELLQLLKCNLFLGHFHLASRIVNLLLAPSGFLADLVFVKTTAASVEKTTLEVFFLRLLPRMARPVLRAQALLHPANVARLRNRFSR